MWLEIADRNIYLVAKLRLERWISSIKDQQKGLMAIWLDLAEHRAQTRGRNMRTRQLDIRIWELREIWSAGSSASWNHKFLDKHNCWSCRSISQVPGQCGWEYWWWRDKQGTLWQAGVPWGNQGSTCLHYAPARSVAGTNYACQTGYAWLFPCTICLFILEFTLKFGKSQWAELAAHSRRCYLLVLVKPLLGKISSNIVLAKP